MADSIPYRAKWQAIKSFVVWKPNDLRALTSPEKSLISRYFSKIGRLKAQGYAYSNRLKPAAILKINKNQRFAAPLLKGAWIKCPPGAKPYFSADGEVTGWTRGGITRIQVSARFFIEDIETDLDVAAVDAEAARVTAVLRKALGRKRLDRCALVFLGGDGPTQSPPVDHDMLIVRIGDSDQESRGKPRVGIAGFHFKRTKNVAKQVAAVKAATAKRNKDRRKRARNDI